MYSDQKTIFCLYTVLILIYFIQYINFIVSTIEEHNNNTVPLAASDGEQLTSNDSAGAQQINCDELLINCVAQKQALFDHRVPPNKRSNLKKKTLWQEVSNLMGGS